MARQVELQAVITARDEASKVFKDFQSRAKGFGDTMTQVGSTMTKRFTLPLVALGGGMAKAAMDLEATQAKYNTVFEGMTEQVDDFITEFQRLTPATRAEARSFYSGIQDLLVPMGFARDEATALTGETMHLAGALANFNSGTHTAEDVTRAFQSALVGQFRPLRDLGVNLDKTTVLQRAMEMTGKDNTEAITRQEEAIALLDLAYANSQDALNAYNEESLDSLTKMRLLKSDVIDLAAELGNNLLPAINDIIDRLSVYVDWVGELDKDKQKLILVTGGLVAAIGPALIVIGQMAKGLAAVSKAAGTLIRFINPLTAAVSLFTIGIVGASTAGRRWNSVLGALAGPIGTTIAFVRNFRHNIDQLRAGIDWLISRLYALRDAATSSLSRLAGTLGIRAFESGGIVPQTGLAMVHEGEKVIPKGAHATPQGEGVTINVYGNVNAGSEDQIKDFGRIVARQFKLNQMGA